MIAIFSVHDQPDHSPTTTAFDRPWLCFSHTATIIGRFDIEPVFYQFYKKQKVGIETSRATKPSSAPTHRI